ncbi:DMT family transporter [Agromyces sp. SYSU K20354]|uniref:EamA family transporter n=1 Tax=Agromyces cavernae TaxID=2898659 RepID=UPI001E3290B5|nr:EamA family transporter [Agromyces cavernae]MCD2441533.1 DMT family transporter [Agromyces cavernae]
MRFVLAVLLAAVCFGTTGTAQALGPDAGALSLGAARLVVGGGALGLVAIAMTFAARRRDAAGTPAVSTRGDGPGHPIAVRAPAHRLPTWAIIAVGAAGVLAYQPAFFAGTAANGVAVGTVVALGSAPVITGALDWALHRRYPGHRWGAATAIATAGVAILAASTGSGTADVGGAATADPLGLLASVGAGASYAVYTLAAKALLDRGWTATGSMGALFGAAGAASVPVLAMTDASWLATGPGIAMALWLGLVATALAYVLFGLGLRGLAPATVSTLTLAEPLTAGLLGVTVLGETLPAGAVAGLVVLAAGIVLLATGSKGGGRDEPAPSSPSSSSPSSSSPSSSSHSRPERPAVPVRDVGGAR